MEVIYILLSAILFMLGVIAYRTAPTKVVANDDEPTPKKQTAPKNKKAAKSAPKSANDKTPEYWRNIYIDGVNTKYRVSNKGKVRSPKGHTLKIACVVGSRGEKRATLFYIANGQAIKRQRYVSRLVANEFVENPNNYNRVLHIDGDSSNNSADNLMWVLGYDK